MKEMSIGSENYGRSIILVRSDISRFSRATECDLRPNVSRIGPNTQNIWGSSFRMGPLFVARQRCSN